MPDRSISFTASGASIFSESTGVLYVVSGSQVLRWNSATGAWLTPYTLTDNLTGLATTSDGAYLFVGMGRAQAGGVGIYRINTATGAQEQLRFPTNIAVGVDDVVMLADDTVAYNWRYGSQSSGPFFSFDARATAPVSTEMPPMAGMYPDTLVSPNGRYMYVPGAGASDGQIAIYDSETGTVVRRDTYIYNYSPARGDVSDDGMVVQLGYNLLRIWDSQLQVLQDLSDLQSYGKITDAQFTRDGDNLLLWNSQTNRIVVYRTSDWSQIGDLDPGMSNGSVGNTSTSGQMDLIGGDRFLILNGSDGAVRIVDLAVHLSLTINGTSAAETLSGMAGADTLRGNDGDDVLSGGGGIDVLEGGAGIDTADYSGATGGVTADLAASAASADGYGASDTLSAIENLTGSAFNDVLQGSGANNILIGGLGADTLSGRNGDDTLHGGTGAANVLQGGFGNDTYVVEAQGDTVTELAGEGVDTVRTTLAAYTLGDHVENLVSIGAPGFSGTGNSAANAITGGTGDDVLAGLGGADQLNGGAGSDTADYSASTGVVTASLLAGTAVDGLGSTDTLTSIENLRGGSAADLLTGDGKANRLEGGAGDDQLVGGAGDDVLAGGAGVDVLSGGAGSDTADYASAAGAVTANLGSGAPVADGHGTTDTLSDIENLRGSAFSDTLIGSVAANRLEGGDGLDQLAGGAGADILDGGAGNDTVNYVDAASGVTASLLAGAASNDGNGASDSLIGVENLTGSAFDDTLTGDGVRNILDGGDGADVLAGGGGDDILTGGAGAANTVQGGLGDDWYVLHATDTVVENASEGLDTVEARIAAYTLASNVENLIFGGTGNFQGAGNSLNNAIQGGAGDDTLSGGGGVDVLTGGNGVDTADYSLAAAAITARLDTMRSTNDGDGGTDTFVSIEAITGSAFNDLLVGGALGDTLKGGLGADTLLGQAGNDVLWGGAGALNQLQGGVGDDRYVLEAADSVVEAAGAGTDTVDARINAYNLAANVENLVFGGVGNFSGAGNALNNVMTGGAGDDLLRGRGGVDSLIGGGGIDTADYSQAVAGVHARLDNMRAVNDGDGGTDTFTSIEAILGSAFNDTLVGGTLGDRLSGGLGTDTLLGFAGNDVLAGGQGLANQLQGGLGDDLYVLDAYDSVVELAGQGHDTIEAHVGAHVMAANVEDMFYVGNNKFYGTGNAGANSITGGIGDDILKGMGGSDRLFGGAGYDEVHVRGAQAQYTVTAEASGWRIVDTVAGRDGSIYVESIEALRFLTGNTKTVLTYGAPAAAEAPGKAAAPETMPVLLDDAFVLPGLKDVGAEVMPELPGDLLASREAGGFEALLARFGANPLVIDGPHGLHLLMDDGQGSGHDGWLF